MCYHAQHIPEFIPNNILITVSQKIDLKKCQESRVETADYISNNTTVNDAGSDEGPSTSGIISLRGQALKSIEDNLLISLRPILKTKYGLQINVNS